MKTPDPLEPNVWNLDIYVEAMFIDRWEFHLASRPSAQATIEYILYNS